MKLRSIKAHGFKSFADKIELDFKSNITAIVGPNGSGKSNIVDAIRWVLGEQSIKSLRGTKEMADVIFAGSETRNPLKRAEVALEFDNQDHFLNSDLVDIEVKRVLYQTGENEYFINGAKVRLKDITNLFLDSGIGNDSLNIISQGSIESIVNSKPVERRVILEGASKVLKYKSRKTESLRKLEKTTDNLEKVQLVLDELKVSLDPLKKQSEDARTYLEIQDKVKELEISLTTFDIKKYHEEYQELERKRKQLEEQRLSLETNHNKETVEIESLKARSLALEEEIASFTEQYAALTKDLAQMESQKTMLLERQKYQVDAEKLNEDFVTTKQRELEIAKELELLAYALEQEEQTLKEKREEKDQKAQEYNLFLTKKQSYDTKYQNLIRKEVMIQNQIEVLKNSIEQDRFVPSSVKAVLNHPRLKGIHGTIESLIEVPNMYVPAMNVLLSSSAHFVVVENEQCAKEAILYLKENHLGRVTFFPLNVIQSRFILPDVLKIAEKIPGFIAIASQLVKYQPPYKNIIENQLGNVFVTKDISSMQQLSKALNYKYRVVTLEGEITHAGGSLTGGSLKKQGSSFFDKMELERLEKEWKETKEEKQTIEESLKEVQTKIQTYETKKEQLQEELFILEKNVEAKQTEQRERSKEHTSLLQSLERTSSYQEGRVEQQIAQFMEEEKKLSVQKEMTEAKLTHLRSEKSTIFSQIEEAEFKNKKQNSELHSVEVEYNQTEITKNKLDVRMDYLLNLLSETYHLTYEKASFEYHLEIEPELAREKLASLKKQIQSFGTVNLGSIEEYDRIKSRYDFLYDQKQDLTLSIEELQNIITEMDEKMIERLTTTFEKIEKEFSNVFQKLFKGGKGMLKLTDPENILETGIEIIAEPPGKKLNNIGLLSGGEKTLTAIALLFAILNVFPVPFCVLDEVEAALDEANVDTFGTYLQSQKEKSEYILITHKKRTMEYADTLYGITMQEQGVSKIVSVQLEEKNL